MFILCNYSFFWKNIFLFSIHFLIWKNYVPYEVQSLFSLTWEVNFKFQIQMIHRVVSSNLIKNFVTFSSSVTLIMLDREFESRNWNSKNSCNCLSYAITNIFWKKNLFILYLFFDLKKIMFHLRFNYFFVNLRSQLQISNSNES